jgi:hypothetical protein
MDFKQWITQFGNDAKDVFKILGPIVAFCGLMAFGMLHVATPIPFVAKFKRDQPDLAHNVAMGMVVLMSVGMLASLISFS